MSHQLTVRKELEGLQSFIINLLESGLLTGRVTVNKRWENTIKIYLSRHQDTEGELHIIFKKDVPELQLRLLRVHFAEWHFVLSSGFSPSGFPMIEAYEADNKVEVVNIVLGLELNLEPKKQSDDRMVTARW